MNFNEMCANRSKQELDARKSVPERKGKINNLAGNSRLGLALLRLRAALSHESAS